MDELTGKLISDSVQQFMDFLEEIKSKVNKILMELLWLINLL